MTRKISISTAIAALVIVLSALFAPPASALEVDEERLQREKECIITLDKGDGEEPVEYRCKIQEGQPIYTESEKAEIEKSNRRWRNFSIAFISVGSVLIFALPFIASMLFRDKLKNSRQEE